MAIADVFDALVTRRCYKAAFTFDRAMDILREIAGSQLDPGLVSAFLKNQLKVYEILTSYSEWAEDEETWV